MKQLLKKNLNIVGNIYIVLIILGEQCVFWNLVILYFFNIFFFFRLIMKLRSQYVIVVSLIGLAVVLCEPDYYKVLGNVG